MFNCTAGEAFLRPFDQGNPKHHWIIVGDRIQNKFESNLVLDIYKSTTLSAWMKTGEYEFNGGENQLWTFEPLL